MKRRLSYKKSVFFVLFLGLTLGFFSAAFASEGEESKPVKVSKVILEHVMDSHVWHITDGLVIPLPVIVYSKEKGLDIFSSAHFFEHHEPVAYNGYNLEHNHITLADSGKPVLDFSITKNVLMLFINATVLLLVSGDTSSGFVDPAKELKGVIKPVSGSGNLKLAASDSIFRKEFEQSELTVSLTSGKNHELQETFFFSPITGFISDKYDMKKAHYGVDIVAKTNEPVKCIADGTVMIASWTQDSGYVIAVQHRGNLISVYKHNAELLKKVGNFVNAGDILSIVGNSGEMTDGPHLHFELWYNGSSLNPEEFVTF